MVHLKMEPQLRRAFRKQQQQLQTSATGKLVRVIIQYHRQVHSGHIQHLAKLAGARSIGSHKRLPTIRAIAVKLPLRCLHELCKHPGVKRVSVDRKRRIRLRVATPSIGAAAAKRSGLTGAGVTIAILDTGIDPHPDLVNPVNRIAAFRDLINNRPKPYDDNGHGTHCAGDAAGNGFSSKGRYADPAPRAKLVGVKVLDKDGVGFDSTIIQGVEWCLSKRRALGIRILSLSLGERAVQPWQQDPLCRAIDHAWKQGLVVVLAAGNSGPGSGTIQSPGITPNAITVGASDDHRVISLNRQTLAGFSSRGPALGGGSKPDLLAPGVGIISLRAPGSTLDVQIPSARVGSRYFTLSGTSLATPLVAGATAQLLQRFPGLSPGQVKSMLKNNAFSLRISPFGQGRGVTNVRFLAASAANQKTLPWRHAKVRL